MNTGVRPRVGQTRIAPGYGTVVLVERQCRHGEGPMYVIGRPDASADRGYRRLAAYSSRTVAVWPLARDLLESEDD